jgi:hypothetical protein
MCVCVCACVCVCVCVCTSPDAIMDLIPVFRTIFCVWLSNNAGGMFVGLFACMRLCVCACVCVSVYGV